jgi:GT2 family glycosyltransferase
MNHSAHVSPELSIVIVNWNAGDLLWRCIQSIIASGPQISYEIVVVDNASQDESLALLRADHAELLLNERLRIVTNSENRGFGPANNQAFALTTAPFVFLLNPDTEIFPDTIDTLIAIMRSDRRIGACAPKIIKPDGSVQISVFHNPPRVWQTVLSNLKLYLLLPRRLRGELLLADHWDHNRRRLVPMVIGAAILARREMIEEVGGFDERFQMYAEDNEWCLRITRAGWRRMFEPEAIVMHHGSQSASKRWPELQKQRVQLEAGYRFQNHVLPRWRVVANQLTNYLIISAQVGWRSLRGINAPGLQLQQKVYGENLKRSLGIRV